MQIREKDTNSTAFIPSFVSHHYKNEAPTFTTLRKTKIKEEAVY